MAGPRHYETVSYPQWSRTVKVRLGFPQACLERARLGSIQDQKRICIQIRTALTHVADANRLTRPAFVPWLIGGQPAIGWHGDEPATHDGSTGKVITHQPVPTPTPVETMSEEYIQDMLSELAEERYEHDWRRRRQTRNIGDEAPCGCTGVLPPADSKRFA